MLGVGRSSAAFSVVNAVPTGVGCAHGVRLYAAVTVELGARGAAPTVEPDSARTPLLAAALEKALGRFPTPGRGILHVTVDSEIPIAKGLKSSSAVATAAIRAVANAVGATPPAEEVAHLAADAGRRAGVSATGAFDDALAGLVPGFVLTDNREDRLIARSPADPDWVAVVHVPAGGHRPAPELRDRFAGSTEAAAAVRAARAGAWAEAMSRNTVVVERAMGYEYGALRARAQAAGALATGVSGFGPALVALAPSAAAERVLATLPAERFVVPLCSEDHP
jgi:shikimate kinase